MAGVSFRFRFLPLTAIASAVLLALKLGAIWQGVDGILGAGIVLPVAEARTPEFVTAAGGDDPPGDAAATDRRPAAALDGDARGGDAAPPTPPPMTDDDPGLFSQTEIDVLQQLAERREALDAREHEIDKRAGMLQAAEVRIDQKVGELKALQGTIEKLIKTYESQQNSKVASLVKIYENMKPKDAARIFEELDIDTLLLVAERMKERKLAPIMAQMNPSKAKQVTVELSRLRQLPQTATGDG